jgi:hypothetical protein
MLMRRRRRRGSHVDMGLGLRLRRNGHLDGCRMKSRGRGG